ncbi:protein TALPID3 isoform X3 [Pangasianodon hypophthalmus]|uniref:protein TALPID3 isoform X3 n=1 Tax=Pangasianodon hypophthalmus TaxID=310915 RepID=UPI0023074E82|nr:protein TALPID3 isoform X3 [Pangasianodon hypophthalmus]
MDLYNMNLDESTSGSDAADVLIRSTKAVIDQKRQKNLSENMESALSCPRDINIYVRRLSDSVHGSCVAESGFLEEMVPPVLPVNTHSASPTAPEDQYHTAANPVARRSEGRHQIRLPRAGRDTLKTSGTQTRDKEQEGKDVLISRYSAHGRGAVVAALKHRSHSAPVRREVKVQLLDAGRPQSSEPKLPEVQPNTALSSRDAEAASTAAAITAAAIAATAPLIKAQSDIEARVAQVASELRRLHEAEGRVNNASESRSGSGADRVVQLQEQLTVLTQQRLQHLEMIQGQQLELQNRLLGSALDAVTARTIPPSQSRLYTGSGVTLPACVHRPGFSRLHVVENAAAGNSDPTVAQEQIRETQRGEGKSQLEMLAPRNVIPKPTHWNRAAYSKQNRTHNPPQTKHRNGRLQEQISNNQKSTRHPAQPDGVRQVAIATVNDSQPEHSRENSGETSIFPTGRAEPERPTGALTKLLSTNESQVSLKGVPTLIHAAPSSSSSAVQQANAMLKDMSRLKNEMRNLIQTADAFPVKLAEPSHPTPPTLPSPPPQPPPPVSMPSEQDDEVTPKAITLSRPNQLQDSHPPASMFEDAERVLRQVRQSRKVLEENLQAILRAKDGEVLHTQLEALSNNRNASEELRIKKTVDAWINTLSKEIQDELAQHGSVVQMKAVERDSVAAGGSAQRDQSSRSKSAAGKQPGRLGRERKGATAAARKKTSHRDSNSPQAASAQASSQELASSFRNSTEQHPQSVVLKSAGDEAYLTKVYGKALYEGHRHTVKKGPYLRFSSPTPKSKVQRPKMIERVKGVKMKSCKTQTRVSGACDTSLLQPVTSEPQYLFSPCNPTQEQQPGSLLKGYLLPMAIPLGKPRVDGQAALPSRVIISDKPATVITSIPPAPKVAPLIRKPNTLLLEVQSEHRKPAPHLEIQVQPSVNIESVSALSHTPSPSPPPLLPPPSFQTGADAQAFEDEAEENDGFPGTNFLEVADNSQEPEMEGEFPDSPIELHGLPSPPVALYHGPTFPTQPNQPRPLTQPILTTIQHRETLENRLVDWVEQQLMARLVSGMFPQPAHTDPATQSEPEDSVTSDTTVETVGGLQLVVDPGMPVDSELIRQYVNEVLADIIALTLGQREGPREPPASVSTQDTHIPQESAVLTPVPTPEPSVEESPPALREAPSPISTPDLSEHPSPAQSPRDSQHAQPQKPVLPEPEKDPVETPICTPVPSPRRTEMPEPANLHKHPWGDVELPLTEEKPHSEGEEQQPLPVSVLSVAHEEEEEAIIHPFSPVPPKPQNPPTAVVEHTEPAPPESPSVKENSSLSSTSITETETETAARHISEGELLLSCGQMAAVRALAEEGFTLQNLMTSFNSSLHGVQDMDYDPPSEGEVMRRPLVSAHHDPVLSLLARMEQGPVSQSQQPKRWWDEESSGEVSEGQRPVLTEAQERVVMGHSLIPQHHSISAEQSPHATLSSPGQSPSQHTGEKGAVAKNGGLSVNVSLSAEHTESPHVLHSFTASSLQPGVYTHQQAAETRPLVHRPTPILVKQYKSTEEPELLHQRRSSNDTAVCFEDMDKGAQRTGAGLELMSVQQRSGQRDSQSPTISIVESDSDSFSDVF